jgi:glycosyltransferase involved in cell wall biosynthesis
MKRQPKVAILGTRGYPSYYGGFETALRSIVPHLANKGWQVTVYGRKNHVQIQDSDPQNNVNSVITRGIDLKTLSTLSYGLTATLHIIRKRPDVVLIMNVANGYFLPLLKIFHIKTVLNVDGLEWQRDKWNGLGKNIFRVGAFLSAKYSDELIADSEEIAKIWKKDFNRDLIYIPYGATKFFNLTPPTDFPHGGYILFVARLVPENSITQFLEAAIRLPQMRFVIVGRESKPGDIEKRLTNSLIQNTNITWLQHVSDQEYLASLWRHSGIYFHGHTVGGTNPALVQAMSLSAPILAVDTPFNREVLGNSGRFTGTSTDEIVQNILNFSKTEIHHYVKIITERANTRYTWDRVCEDYHQILLDLTAENRKN